MVFPNPCLSQALEYFEAHVSGLSHITVAFSGGLDSTVLLHLLSGSSLKGRLNAHYVDHGLQSASADWAQHCQEVCDGLSIPFQVSQVCIASTQRTGMESVARKQRYLALTKGKTFEQDVLVTGHHQRDQAETLLLNLARGAGVTGLSAMPYSKVLRTESGEVTHIRPLLGVSYSSLVLYARFFDLDWIEDPSNASVDYRRNRVRHTVLPALQSSWPAIEKTLARTADHLSEAQQLLDRLARTQLASVKHGENCDTLYFDFEKVAGLDWVEKKNCLRYWISQQGKTALSSKHYEWIKQVLSQQAKSRQGAFSYQLPTGVLRFYKHRLYYQTAGFSEFRYKGISFHSTLFSEEVVELEKANKLFLILQLRHGKLYLETVSCLESREYYLWEIDSKWRDMLPAMVLRNVSEEDDLNRKKLKHFFQSNGVPSWERPFWPVLEYQNTIVSVLGCPACFPAQKNLPPCFETLRAGDNKKEGGGKNTFFKLFVSQIVIHDLMCSESG